MGRLIRYAILFALGLSCAGFCPIANSLTSLQKKTSKKPTGSISGHITLKGKGKAGIAVVLGSGDSGPQQGPLSKGITDQDGNYRITDLPAGNYQLAPIAPALVVSDFNTGSRGKTLILSEGENVDGIDFSLVRGGVITGKVSQTDGRPVVEERINVTLVEQTDRSGTGSLMGSSFQTDDRGIYRVFGLPAGKYKISIGQSPDAFFGGPSRGRPSYERVFHPDVTNPDEAKIVEVGEGDEAKNIDITVGPSITGFAAGGMIIDGETNQPLANLRFGLQRIVGERNANFFGTTVLSDRLGAFRFENLMPGKYSVFMMPQQSSDLRVESVAFEVVDQDVTGIMLRTSRGASVSGTVVLEGNHDKTVQSKITQLRVQAYVRSETATGGFGQSSLVNPDGSFRVGGLPAGIAQFQIGAQNRELLKGFVLSRVEREGVVLPRGIEIKSGEETSGLRIVVIFGSGIIHGAIKVENGPLPTGARLMIRLAKPDDTTFAMRAQDVDARGRFVMEGVPGGSYDLYVNSFIPGSRERQPSTKQSISVTEGSVTEVEAVIDLGANTSPTP